MYKKIIFILVAFLLLLAPSISFAAYVSDICPGDPYSTTVLCPKESVGWFLQGVTNACGNAGNCTLTDIMVVVANVGNFVLRIIAAITLFMYVLGGFWILASHGSSEWVSKGKKTITIATTGLVIVMFAYIGVSTMYKVLTNKTPPTGTGGSFVATCDASTEGSACAASSVCFNSSCVFECEAKHAGYSCKSVADPTSANCIQTSGLCPSASGFCCK